MSDLFFYGTLRHVPLLKVVLGRDFGDAGPVPAVLHGFEVSEAANEPFPVIREAAGASAPGLLMRGLSEADVARLIYYEAGFDFDLRSVSVELASGGSGKAQVFFPKPGRWPVAGLWSLDVWTVKWAALSTRAATEVMAHYGRYPASDIAEMFRGIRIRATAWVAAQTRPADPDRDLDRDVVVHAHHRKYANFFASEEMDLQFRRHDGSLSEVINRGAQVLGLGTAVLPYDPVRDAVVMVEQFRAPVFIGGDPAPWIWEPISGLVDPGESPQQAAHREAMEEAGLQLSHLEDVGGLYSSTGNNSEFVHLFVGLTDIGDQQTADGLDEEGEDIRSRVMSFDDLMQAVDNQQFRDMPLVTAALWLARHRDRLRKTA